MSLAGRTFTFKEVITFTDVLQFLLMTETPNDLPIISIPNAQIDNVMILTVASRELTHDQDYIACFTADGQQTLLYVGTWLDDSYRSITFLREPPTVNPSLQAFETWLLDNATEGGGTGVLSEFEDPDGNVYYYKDALARADIEDLKDNQYQSPNNFPYVGKVGKSYIALDENVEYRWDESSHWYVRMGYYPVFTGATQSGDAGTEGLVPAPTANDTNLYLKGNGTWSLLPVETLYYLTSTWSDFYQAYNRNATVFCMVGNQIAPMYSVDSANPTEVSFIGYEYDSNNSVYETTIYKLNSNDVWSSHTYQTPVIPSVTSADNGKILQVVNGAWAAVTIPSANGVSF